MDRQPADPDFPETSVPLDGTGFGAGGLTPSGRFSAEVGDGRRPSWQRYGGNARVIPGKNEQTGEEVAIKLVAKVHPYHRHRNDIVAANRVAEVRREAEIGCAVPPHPNVIRYYAAEENEFWFFLIMEMGVVELFDLVTDGGAQTQYEESTRVAAQLVGEQLVQRVRDVRLAAAQDVAGNGDAHEHPQHLLAVDRVRLVEVVEPLPFLR